MVTMIEAQVTTNITTITPHRSSFLSISVQGLVWTRESFRLSADPVGVCGNGISGPGMAVFNYMISLLHYTLGIQLSKLECIYSLFLWLYDEIIVNWLSD